MIIHKVIPVLVLGVLLLIPGRGFAGTSACLLNIHRQAISDAIYAMPSDLKSILLPLEKSMHERVVKTHGLGPSDRRKFSEYYQIILDTIRKNKYDNMANFMAEITIYPFIKYCPIRAYDNCNDAQILNSTTLIYDGYDESPNFTIITNGYFLDEPHKFLSNDSQSRLKEMYISLANEISDIWISLWKNAGKNIGILLPANTVLKRSVEQERKASVTKGYSTPGGASGAPGVVYTEETLNRYRATGDFTDVAPTSSYRGAIHPNTAAYLQDAKEARDAYYEDRKEERNTYYQEKREEQDRYRREQENQSYEREKRREKCRSEAKTEEHMCFTEGCKSRWMSAYRDCSYMY